MNQMRESLVSSSIKLVIRERRIDICNHLEIYIEIEPSLHVCVSSALTNKIDSILRSIECFFSSSLLV